MMVSSQARADRTDELAHHGIHTPQVGNGVSGDQCGHQQQKVTQAFQAQGRLHLLDSW